MNAAGKFVIRHEPLHLPDAHELLLEINACGICGSDKAIYRGDPRHNEMILGHEVIGIIKEIGPDSYSHWERNDIVAVKSSLPCRNCRNCLNHREEHCFRPRNCTIGGFSDYICIHEDYVVPFSKKQIESEYILAEPLSVALSLVRESLMIRGDTVLVSGSGAIGLLAAWFLKQDEVEVTLLTHNPDRFSGIWLKERRIQSLSYEELGGHPGKNRKWNTIIATSAYDTICGLPDHLCAGGHLVFNGFNGKYHSYHALDLSAIHRNCQSIKGVFSRPQIYMEEAVTIVKEKGTALKSMITHKYRLSEINEAFKFATAPADDAIKIIVLCCENSLNIYR